MTKTYYQPDLTSESISTWLITDFKTNTQYVNFKPLLQELFDRLYYTESMSYSRTQNTSFISDNHVKYALKMWNDVLFPKLQSVDNLKMIHKEDPNNHLHHSFYSMDYHRNIPLTPFIPLQNSRSHLNHHKQNNKQTTAQIRLQQLLYQILYTIFTYKLKGDKIPETYQEKAHKVFIKYVLKTYHLNNIDQYNELIYLDKLIQNLKDTYKSQRSILGEIDHYEQKIQNLHQHLKMFENKAQVIEKLLNF